MCFICSLFPFLPKDSVPYTPQTTLQNTRRFLTVQLHCILIKHNKSTALVQPVLKSFM